MYNTVSYNDLISVLVNFPCELGQIMTRYDFLGPISHPVVKRWLLKPAFKHSLTSVYLSLSTEWTTHLQALVMCKLTGNDTCRHISRDIWLIIIVWNWFFWLGIHHVSRIRRIRCHMGFPPPPWISFPRIKYHIVKVPHLWELSPPPPKTNRTCCPSITWGMCVGGDLQ